MTVNTAQISVEILLELFRNAAMDAMMPAVCVEQRTRAMFGKAEDTKPIKGHISGRAIIQETRGRDIYGQEKSTDVRYFECANCERSVAGHRFAAHAARCGGKRR